MKKTELNTLSLNNRYKFIFYHGRVEYGILCEDAASEKIYLINHEKLPLYISQKKTMKEVGEEINIETIAHWESIEGQKYHPKYSPVSISGSPFPKATKLVIIGAGASFGFLTDDKNKQARPPLAKELFADRFDSFLNIYPGAKNMAAEILVADDIEEYFQNKWMSVLSNRNNLLLSKLINVQFYFHHLFLQVSKESSRIKQNNYNILINLVHDYAMSTGEHVLFANFNYDTLLEEAMQKTVQYSFTRHSEYIDYKNRKLLLFKPHGSCNFIKKFDRRVLSHLPTQWNVNSVTILSRLLYDHKTGYDIINANLEDTFALLNRDEIINVAADTSEILYLPQLLLPFKSKDDFIMPHEHTVLLEHFLAEINEIIVLGWKGTEAKFQHLLGQKLGRKPIKVTAITNGDETIKAEFAKSLPQANCDLHFQTFSEYMKFCVHKNCLFEQVYKG